MKVHLCSGKCKLPLALPGTALLTSDIRGGGCLKRQGTALHVTHRSTI